MSLNCAVCKSGNNLLRCTACKGIYYCSPDHQKDHWKNHKSTCAQLKLANTEGVVVEVRTKGDETKTPKKGSKVTVHYTGTLPNGDVFDSSVKKNKPFVFTLGAQQVIKGWDEGVAKMHQGEKSTLYIGPHYGYGEQGVSGVIPPSSPLIFEVELLSFE